MILYFLIEKRRPIVLILLNAENLSKGYSDRQLLDGCSLAVNEGDKIGLIGVNGTGKSTLLKIIAGLDFPDSGTVTRAGGVRVAYLPQNPVFSENATVLEQVMKGVAISEELAEEAKVRQQADEYQCKTILTKLGLSDYDQKISLLSGGQKRRVAMACALAAEAEVLILDEPTNDLDIETLSVLEDYLEEFPGVVIAVSHDRYFLDKLMNHVFVLAGDGQITHYTGGYADYRADVAAQEKAKKAAEPAKAKTTQDGRNQREKLKFSFKEQREYEQIDEAIASLEEKIQQTEKDIAANSSDYGALQELTEKKEQLETELAEKMERWVYLNDLAERIEAQKKQ